MVYEPKSNSAVNFETKPKVFQNYGSIELRLKNVPYLGV